MKGFPKTVSILALPLFIEGNRRVSENRQEFTRCLSSESRFETGFRAQYPEGGREFL